MPLNLTNVVLFPKRMAQIKNFGGMRFDGYTPTDIDVAFEYNAEFFIFGELKLVGVELPKGQELMLRHLCQVVNKSGGECLVFVAEHDTTPEQEIDVANCIITEMLYTKDGVIKQRQDVNKTVKHICDAFLKRWKDGKGKK